MEPKQLVEKFVNGEITEEQFNDDVSKMTPEQKEVLNKEAEGKLPDAVEKLKGVRRGIKKISERGENDDTLIERQKQENLDEAKEKFFVELGIEKDEERKAFEAGFKTNSINVTNILKDMKSHYASMNSDELISLRKEKQKLSREAEEENARNAGANGGSGGGDGGSKKVSKDAQAYMDAAKKSGRIVTPEFAEKAVSAFKNKGRIA